MTTTARTARTITFGHRGDPVRRTLITATRDFPAGTEVYVHRTRTADRLRIRVTGTLYEQYVNGTAITEGGAR